MDTLGVNRVLLLGRVGKYGGTWRQQGTDCTNFLLNVPERGRDGPMYTTRIPIEIWGKHAQEVTRCAAGQLVLIEGKRRRRKRADEEWKWCVSAFEAVPIGPATTGGDPRQPSLF